MACYVCSKLHNSVALLETPTFKDPNLPNVHCRFLSYKQEVTTCNQSLYHFCHAVASFKIVSVNKYKAQKELDDYLKR